MQKRGRKDVSYVPADEPTDTSSQMLSFDFDEDECPMVVGTRDDPKYYIVEKQQLCKLFKNCQCGETAATVDWGQNRGAAITVTVECTNTTCTGMTWSNSKMEKAAAEVNFEVAMAAMLTGVGTTVLTSFMSESGIAFPSSTYVAQLQTGLAFPAIEEIYEDEKEILREELRETQPGSFSGDRRFDSPGFCATHCTYSIVEETSRKIVEFQQLHRSEASSSSAMETMGCRQTLTNLMEDGVKVEIFATDGSTTIEKLLSSEFKETEHELDLWHLTKNLKKRLQTRCKKAAYKPLLEWIPAICYHLWFCSQQCHGDYEVMKRLWLSCLYHVLNKHSWKDENGVTHKCQHGRLPRLSARKKKMA